MNHGIDSITIQVKLPTLPTVPKTQSSVDNNVDKKNNHNHVTNDVADTHLKNINQVLLGIEHLLRGINSLQEVLHHSVNQYIMVSTTKFVSFDEYILPVILILIPLALRVIIILYPKVTAGTQTATQTHCLQSFQYALTFQCLLQSIILSLVTFISNRLFATFISHPPTVELMINSTYILVYILSLQSLNKLETSSPTIITTTTSTKNAENSHQTQQRKRSDERQSLQLLSCIIALYLHVPIALVHVSLALVSALTWVPLLAFVTYSSSTTYSFIPMNVTPSQKIKNVLLKIFIIIMTPPITKHVVTLYSMYITKVNTTLPSFSLIVDMARNVSLLMKDVNPLSSSYFTFVYIPLHFILSVIYFR